MTRTLLAFGDSHTAGAEILIPEYYECYSKAYPAHIAKHYGMEYRNYSQAGGSNDWSIRKFHTIIDSVIKNNEDVFVLINFCDPARTFVEIENPYGYEGPLHFYPAMLTDKKCLEDDIEYNRLLRIHLPKYIEYLKTNEKSLNTKSLAQIIFIQNICKENNIPFIFHTSNYWYPGIWERIDKKNFYGHTKNFYPNSNETYTDQQCKYSFWGYATNDSYWKHFQKVKRWKDHYPEEFHIHWAEKLINFIDEQKILEGYI